jgi:hypothetical protein
MPKENPHLVGSPIMARVVSIIEQVQEPEEYCASGGHMNLLNNDHT